MQTVMIVKKIQQINNTCILCMLKIYNVCMLAKAIYGVREKDIISEMF